MAPRDPRVRSWRARSATSPIGCGWGYVVDFVSVGIGDLRWPAFNVADPALVGGIILLVAYLTFFADEPRRQDEPAA